MILSRRTALVGAGAAALTPSLGRAAEPTAWLNRPKVWTATGSGLSLRAESGSDFWRKTLSEGRNLDSGHFYFREIVGDFISTVTVEADYGADADQTGLMVRVDAETWMKSGIEWLSGQPHAASVFTRDWSDGSVTRLEGWTGPVTLRVTRRGPILTCGYGRPGQALFDARLGYLPMGRSVQLGLTACAPFGPGFEARFSDWAVSSA